MTLIFTESRRLYRKQPQQQHQKQNQNQRHQHQHSYSINPHHHHQLHNHQQLWLPLVFLLFAPSFFSIDSDSSSITKSSSIFCHAIGYSYARFVGPVVGPEREIIVHDELNGGTRVDYVARPDYQFAYGVEDSETQLLQNRKETRLGDVVKGVYSVVDPDGTLRVVKYTADDENGFQAEVTMDGVATIHGQNDDDGGRVAANYALNQNYADDDDDDVEDDDDQSEHVYKVHEEQHADEDESETDEDEDENEKDGGASKSAEATYEANENESSESDGHESTYSNEVHDGDDDDDGDDDEDDYY